MAESMVAQVHRTKMNLPPRVRSCEHTEAYTVEKRAAWYGDKFYVFTRYTHYATKFFPSETRILVTQFAYGDSKIVHDLLG